MPHTLREQKLREEFYKQFPAFKNRAYTQDTQKAIADWWITRRSQEFAEIRRKVGEIGGDFRSMASPDSPIVGEEYTQGWNDALQATSSILTEMEGKDND